MHHAMRPDIYPPPQGSLVEESWFEERPQRPAQELLVALRARQVVGLVQVARQQVPGSPFQRERLVARIDALAVALSSRRSGIGTLLMRAAQEWAQQLGAVEIRLSVDAFNTEAIGFYKELGFGVVWQWMTMPLPSGDGE